MYILSTGMVGAATPLVYKGSKVQGPVTGTLEARIPRRGEPELWSFHQWGDSKGHTHPSDGRNVQTGPSGSAFRLGEGFLEDMVFPLGLEGQVRLEYWK